jgi:hypothetical protein
MGTTPKFGIPYPEASDSPFVHLDLKKLADAVAGALAAVTTERPFGHMGRTGGFQAIGTDPTKVLMDTAQVLQGGVTFDNANDALIIPETGVYRVTVRGYATGGSAYWHDCAAYLNGARLSQAACRFTKPDSQDYLVGASGLARLNAGDAVSLYATRSGSTGSTYGTDGYNGAFVEVEYVGE